MNNSFFDNDLIRIFPLIAYANIINLLVAEPLDSPSHV